MMAKKEMHVFTVRVTKEQNERLVKFCERTSSTKTSTIAMAVEHFLSYMEAMKEFPRAMALMEANNGGLNGGKPETKDEP